VKVRGSSGKWVLRQCAKTLLPSASARPKFPYRAPAPQVVGPTAPGWARQAFSPDEIRDGRVFDPDKVGRLVKKLEAAYAPMSEVDAMGVTALASAQLLPKVLKSAGRVRPEKVQLEVE
jgi:hypothetical protein